MGCAILYTINNVISVDNKRKLVYFDVIFFVQRIKYNVCVCVHLIV